jgi:signal transduction protein with GAF and PtsI domain
MNEGKFCPPFMCELCEELARAYDLGESLSVLAENIAEAMGVKAVSVRLLDEKNMTLEIRAAHGLSRDYLEKGPVELDRHPVDRRVLGGEAVATRDVTAEPHVLYQEEARREGIKSVLSVPLTVRGRAVGVLRAYTGEPHDFTEEEVDNLRNLAAFAGVIADRARLWQRMTALVEIARSISSTLSVQEVLDKIVESAAKSLGFRAASLRLLDEERKSLEVRAAWGLSKAYLAKGPVEIDKSPIDRECIAGNVVRVEDISRDGRLQYPEEIEREGIAALLSIPLRLKGSVIGVLRVYTSIPYSFGAEEVDFLSALASQGAVAIENARLFEHIKRDYEDLARDVWKWYDWGARFPKI